MEAEKKVNGKSIGTHEYLINLISSQLSTLYKSKSNPDIKIDSKFDRKNVTYLTVSDFNNTMIKLKKYRVQSDYGDIEIAIDHSNDSIKFSNSIIEILKPIFKSE